jgi:hypothetical protein
METSEGGYLSLSVLNGDWPPNPNLPLHEQIQRVIEALEFILEGVPIGAGKAIAQNQRTVESNKVTILRHEQMLEAIEKRLLAIEKKLAGVAEQEPTKSPTHG